MSSSPMVIAHWPTMVARGAVVITQESDIGGSTGDGEGWLRNEEEGKWGRRRQWEKYGGGGRF